MSKKRKRKTKRKSNKQHLTRRELKEKAVNLMGGACVRCGYKAERCLAAMSFHHLDPSKKDFGISRLIATLSWDKIVEELQKTILVCLNCHTEIHHGINR